MLVLYPLWVEVGVSPSFMGPLNTSLSTFLGLWDLVDGRVLITFSLFINKKKFYDLKRFPQRQ